MARKSQSRAGSATGTVRVETVVLVTPEELDRAVHMTTDYRAPGA
ncbi:MAG: hypothetical protein ABIZ34_07665 [Candidatus Limnocylindrales bacterium]